MIPDDQVEEVKARADIVDVVSQFVELKKAGKEFKANCPFHDEKTPSFYVVPDKGFYKCFGCGESGDVFNFVQKRLGLDFVESVKHVAARAGVEVREIRRGPDEDEDPRRPLYEAMAFASEWFQAQLKDEKVGASARAYLDGRGIDEETCERFAIGLAPDEWRGLREAAAKHGITDELLLQVGLLTSSEKMSEPYDKFRNRIVFPIEALGGKVVAFGGRILGESGPGQPKYLNSPETPIYHKSEILYGLHRSRHAIRREGSALVVEGYMDLVSIAAAGFDHVVAALGTAMTVEHAKLLRRYTQKVQLLFDSDRAGLKATFRAADLLLAESLLPLVVTLPDGEDPDTLVQAEGPEALQKYLDQAVDVLDRKIQILEERDWFDRIERRRDAVDRLLPTLRAVADPTLRDLYVDRVAKRTGLRRETLEAEMAKKDRPGHSPRPATAPAPKMDDQARRVSRQRPHLGAEWTFLRVLARDPERRHEILESALMHIGPEDFKDGVDRTIFQLFLDDPDLAMVPPDSDPLVTTRLEQLLAEPLREGQLAHAGQEVREAVNALRGARLGRQIDEIQGRIEAARDSDEKLRLIGEKAVLRNEVTELGHAGGGTFARRHARGFNPTD